MIDETIKIEIRTDSIPKGAKLVEGYETEHSIIIMYDCLPPDDHCCDQMGCGSFSHVKYRFTKP